MNLTSKTGGIVLSVLELAVGILLLVSPVKFTGTIIIFSGVVLLVSGITELVRYFKTEPLQAALSQYLTRGSIEILLGVFCVFKSRAIIGAFTLITIFYGLVILLIGIVKLQRTVDMLRLKSNRWSLAAISCALMIICAVIILLNPFESTAVLWIFTAIALIVEAVIDIIVFVVVQKTTTDVK